MMPKKIIKQRTTRHFATIIVVVLFSSIANAGQTNGLKPAIHQSSVEQTVAILLADNGRAPIPGFVETLVVRLGDGASVGVMQYLGDRKRTVAEDATSPEEIERILLIVRMAFSAPNVIELEENRSPKATLVLLRYLGTLTSAASQHDNIDGTSRFVEDLKLRQSNEPTSQRDVKSRST